MIQKLVFTFATILLGLLSNSIYAHEGNHSPIYFVPNLGQWQHDFKFKGISPNADIYLEKDGVKFLVGHPSNNDKIAAFKSGAVHEQPVLDFHAYKITWVGADKNAITQGDLAASHYSNYFLGNDPQRWKSHVSSYKEVNYKNVYPKTDFRFYTTGSDLKYDVLLKPGANPNLVKLRYDGLNGIAIDKAGNLILTTSVGTIQEQKPYAYQYIDGVKKEVKCKYELGNNTLSFSFPKGYDKNAELVIDPQMIFASLTGSNADNWGFTATYDAQGNLYAGGIVRGAGYPVTIGVVQGTYGGGNTTQALGIDCDISISKFNSVGNALVYSTYIGGSSNEMPHSLVVDAGGNLIIGGKTVSTNYPTKFGSYDTIQNGGFDIIITKLNPTGTDLVGSTYVGGTGDDGVNITANFYSQSDLKYNYGDDARSEVVVDDAGNIYMVGSTRSSDFPVSSNALKSAIGGAQDAVLLKFNPTLSTMMYGSYIGGSTLDGGYSIALNRNATHIYISGGTNSSDFHSTSTTGAYQATNNGGIDGFIMRFQNSGNYPLLRTTYIGTSAYDQVYGLQIDNSNNIYVMGQTQGSFPVFPAGVYSNPGSRQFVMKLDSTLATGLYSTVFGTGAVATVNMSPVAFLVDTCENVYISGWGGLTVVGPPTSVNGMPITPATALQSTTDGSDFYFIVLKKDVQSLLYGSFFGAAGIQEHVDGGTSRFDPNGVVYQAMCASCGVGSNFPATPGAYATSENSGNCNLGVVKIAFNLGSVSTDAEATPSATGCAPFTVNFLDNSANATNWNWNFGDGNTSTQQQPTHTFTTPGVYNVRLIGSNPDACRVLDTSFVTITVTNDYITPNFTYTVLDSCQNFRISINNTSTGFNGGSTAGATFFWDFGNGITFNGANPSNQNYASPGTYNIMLVMDMAGSCNGPDTVFQTVTFDPIFVTAPSLPPIDACVGTEVQFPGGGSNVNSYAWNFGDGSTSELPTPTHTYTSPGTYNIQLQVSNPNSCNKTESVSTTVTVHPSPTVAFTVTPAVAEPNVPFTFNNQSTGASSYLWTFGDGASSTLEHPTHAYNRTGSYDVCLTATNQFNCSMKLCRSLEALVYPLADVPSGFSPNGDGNNDVFRVRGYGIEKMNLSVYNRWGELIFESTNQDIGWDGTYKGKPQEMDAYAYVLSVGFVDGTSVKKSGNVTLIR